MLAREPAAGHGVAARLHRGHHVQRRVVQVELQLHHAGLPVEPAVVLQLRHGGAVPARCWHRIIIISSSIIIIIIISISRSSIIIVLIISSSIISSSSISRSISISI